MKIVKVTLQKSGYRNQLKDIDELIRAMETDVESSGFIVTEVEATLNTNGSQYHIEVRGELMNALGDTFGVA